MLKKVALSLFALLIAGGVQAQLVPYYGKNNVKYDTFNWKTYKTTHFDIYFYPQSEAHLQRVASMAESAYDRISAYLQHDIEFRIPLIFFKTQSEFEQVNYLQISEGILGAAEPSYNRMAFAIDQPSDKLQDLISHELTHVFEFSMLFGGIMSPIVRSSPPLWVMEGFADYMTGTWDPGDLQVVRDAVLTERLPFVSVERDMIYPGGTAELGRAPYNVGHSVWEFIKARYGDAAIRQLWFYLKKSTLLGTEDVIFSALGVKEEEFNEQFSLYLRERFKDYRDKQSPIDYGKEIPLPGNYFQVFSQAPSPDGRRFAIFTANREDYEFDILLIDRSGKVIENVTKGLTTSYDYITTDDYRFEGRNISWSSDGRRLAYFARTGKRRSLFIADANNGKRLKKIKLKLDQAASPSISPDGRTVIITGFLNGQPDLFAVDVESGKYKPITNDLLYEKTPMYSSDGKWIFYTSRINSRDQIMRVNTSGTPKFEQLTNSDYDSTSPYLDVSSDRLYYAADRNGAYNLYALDMKTGDKIQYTDVIGGNFSPWVFKEDNKSRIAFTGFFKGQYRLFITDLPTPITTIAAGSEGVGGETLQKTAEQTGQQSGQQAENREFPMQGPLLSDFQPKKEVPVNKQNIQDKKMRLLVGGRPDVITAVSGDAFAVASGIVLQDILGDQEFRFYISRIRGFQSYYAGYLDLGHRFQYLADFIFNDDFYYTTLTRDLAQSSGFTTGTIVERVWGGRISSQYPLNRYYRVELGAGLFRLSQHFYEPEIQGAYQDQINTPTGLNLSSGNYMPLSVALVAETTRFREFGPVAGHTFRLSVDYSPPLSGSWIDRQIYQADVRKYFRTGSRSLIAARARGFYSTGQDALTFAYGGGLSIRGYDFREVSGNKGGIANVEYRLPLFPNPRTPFLGQMRARVFMDYFRVSYNPDLYGMTQSDTFSLNLIPRTVNGVPFAIDTYEGAGSLGAGFTVFAGGLPLNFDFSKGFGNGRLADVNGFITKNTPIEFNFTDGLQFDFSIGYEF